LAIKMTEEAIYEEVKKDRNMRTDKPCCELNWLLQRKKKANQDCQRLR